MGRTRTAYMPEFREQYRSVGADREHVGGGIPVRLNQWPSRSAAGSLRPGDASTKTLY